MTEEKAKATYRLLIELWAEQNHLTVTSAEIRRKNEKNNNDDHASSASNY